MTKAQKHNRSILRQLVTAVWLNDWDRNIARLLVQHTMPTRRYSRREWMGIITRTACAVFVVSPKCNEYNWCYGRDYSQVSRPTRFRWDRDVCGADGEYRITAPVVDIERLCEEAFSNSCIM